MYFTWGDQKIHTKHVPIWDNSSIADARKEWGKKIVVWYRDMASKFASPANLLLHVQNHS
jgi:hypothetical protein